MFDCYTNEEMGVALFEENQCSFIEQPAEQLGASVVSATSGANEVDEGDGISFSEAVVASLVAVAAVVVLFVGYRIIKSLCAKGTDSSKGVQTNSVEPISEDEASASSSTKDMVNVAHAASAVEVDENVETVHISNLGALRQKLRMLDCSRPVRTGE